MSNYIETYKQGKLGKNFGMDTGLSALNKAINGLQRRMSIGLAAAPKCGKTTLCDYSFIISPYLYMEKMGLLDKLHFTYFSYEIDRISKEFKYTAFFFYHDYNISTFVYKGVSYGMCAEYLMGEKMHENSDKTLEQIPVTEEHELIIKEIYTKRIIPLFGEYDARGIKINNGLIDFIEEPENPTGLNKYLEAYAASNGNYMYEEYETHDDKGVKVVRKRKIAYIPNDPDAFHVIVTDHIRKLRRERGFSMKETIDKWLEYSTILRNRCGFTFIHIIHSNRNLANVDRLRMAGEFIFPTSDDCKDSGNPAEECSIFMTLFNPNDEKYNLKRHFGVDLEGFPNYRSLHITEARKVPCPLHMQFNMYGGINCFTPLNTH